MSKTTLNLRIDSKLKNQAETIFEDLGISTSAAIVMYLKTVVREGGIPFEIRLNKKAENIRPTKEKPVKEKAFDTDVLDGDSLLSAINKL